MKQICEQKRFPHQQTRKLWDHWAIYCPDSGKPEKMVHSGQCFTCCQVAVSRFQKGMGFKGLIDSEMVYLERSQSDAGTNMFSMFSSCDVPGSDRRAPRARITVPF
jgi:hypothetical protein